MALVTKILVPTDFSPPSQAAIKYAIELARKFGATVDVLHVWEEAPYTGPEVVLHVPGQAKQTLEQYAVGEAGREMKKFLTEIDHASSGVKVGGRIESGRASEAILKVAQSGYDLVVMGTHGRTGIGRALLGSVAEKVVRKSKCPVLVMHADASTEALAPPPHDPTATAPVT